MMTKAELAFSALDRDNKENLVDINISILNINICEAEIILCLTRYSRATSLKKISRN